MTRTFVRTTLDVGDRAHVLLAYLDYLRETVAEKAAALADADARRSILPSGWSPVELLAHLVYMERRWLVWGFLAERVPDPWGDDDESGRWAADPDESVASLVERLRAGGRRTRQIVESASLDDQAGVGGRFETQADAPTLERILLHVMQEYARHAGHLDIVVELVAGAAGE